MSINTKTTSEVTHRTVITGCEGLRDGGLKKLTETHDLIHVNGQSGRLILDYANGCVCNVQFEEKEHIAQSDLPKIAAALNNGFSTRGRISYAHTDVGP
jgi:hypothetical protein